MNRTFFCLIALLLPALLMTGCGESLPAGMPRLYSASILVTQEGEPLAGALVMLLAEDEDLTQWGPGGVTDASGVAQLQTNGRYKGAPLGTYKVAVTKRETEPHPNPEWANLPDGDPNFRRFVEIGNRLRTYDYIETQYGSIIDTPLRVEITARQRAHTVDVGRKIATEAQIQR